MELYARLSTGETEETTDGYLLFNPFFKMPTDVVASVINSINSAKKLAPIQVLSDNNNVPIAYYIKQKTTSKEVRCLSLLSAMDAELDASFLRNILLAKTEILVFNKVKLKKSENNDFNYNRNYEKIYCWITSMALKTASSFYCIEAVDNNGIEALPLSEILEKRKSGIQFHLPQSCPIMPVTSFFLLWH